MQQQCNFILNTTNNRMEDNFKHSYNEKVEHLIDKIDFKTLAKIKLKELKNLTNVDLELIGFQQQQHDEIENLYCFEDLDHIKVYVNRCNNKYELRGYMLHKEKDILTTKELLDETLTKWKLKI